MSVDPHSLKLLEGEMSKGWYFLASIYRLHEELRETYEELVWNGGSPVAEALVAAQLTAFAVAQVRPIEALDRANEPSAAFSMLRTAEENASNLFYILYAGPAAESRAAGDFADQFLAYRYVDHARFLNKHRAEYEAKFKAGFSPKTGPKTLAEFGTLCASVEARKQATLARYPMMDRGSWHNVNKEDRSTRVVKHLPAFAEPVRELWASIAGSTSLHNFQIHASPVLFEEDPAKLTRGRILEMPVSADPPDAHWSVLAAKFAHICWLALSDIAGTRSEVEATFQRIQAEEVTLLVEKLRVPTMVRVH